MSLPSVSDVLSSHPERVRRSVEERRTFVVLPCPMLLPPLGVGMLSLWRRAARLNSFRDVSATATAIIATTSYCSSCLSPLCHCPLYHCHHCCRHDCRVKALVALKAPKRSAIRWMDGLIDGWMDGVEEGAASTSLSPSPRPTSVSQSLASCGAHRVIPTDGRTDVLLPPRRHPPPSSATLIPPQTCMSSGSAK